MKELDCRGLACPQPVLNTKDALEEIESGRIRVIVDNQAAKENVSRFAGSQGCTVEARQDGALFILTIDKGSPEESPVRRRRQRPGRTPPPWWSKYQINSWDRDRMNLGAF